MSVGIVIVSVDRHLQEVNRETGSVLELSLQPSLFSFDARHSTFVW